MQPRRPKRKRKSMSRRRCDSVRSAAHLALSLLSALSLVLVLPGVSLAEVQRTDTVMGQSMEARGLSAAECPSIDAKYAIVVDDDGIEYFGRGADTAANIASITKIMTAVVALERADADTRIYVSRSAASVGESSAGLLEGDMMDLKSALIALMVPSGNDAAIAIGESIGKAILEAQGSDAPSDSAALDAFIEAMNVKAAELGCADTVFENPHGLDFDEFSGNLHSTAADVSLIARHAMGNELFRSIVKMETAQIDVSRGGQTVQLEFHSTDELLGNYEGACGIKTGSTDLAGPCFAGACERNGRYLYAIVLDSADDAQRFVDTETLFNWVYSNQIDYKLANSDTYQEMQDEEGAWEDVPVVAYVSLSAWLDKTVPATFADPDQAVSVFRLEGNVSQEFEFYDIPGSVRAGDVVGKASFYQRNAKIAETDLVACEDVPAPGIFDTVGIWFTRIGNAFTGAQDAAESAIVNKTPLILEKG